MKYIVEINEKNMVRKFVDDEGNEFKEVWIVKGPGHTTTIGKGMDVLMEEKGEFDDDLLCAIESGDLSDIWEAIREN